MRERGLCVDHTTIYRWVQRYAPEIAKRCRPRHRVAPRAGARIETWGRCRTSGRDRTSPPVRGRGLKLRACLDTKHLLYVAPRAGARIETRVRTAAVFDRRRPPCGGAD